MWIGTRRGFLKAASAAVAAGSWALNTSAHAGQQRRSSAAQQDEALVLNPRMRVPLSFLIDDSTCLVNMGRFCMPQFATAWPQRDIYKKPWKTWPAEIPDAFLREFGEWCAEHGVKGKFSIVPYPACVGWLDRELPGWSRRELLSSLKLVRDVMVPNWDIHPEMISHTRVIDIKTGRPFAEISPATMENSYPQSKKSVDELAAYLAYALQLLKNCDLPCQGITTPGGFGNSVKTELSLAVQQAVQDVYPDVEVPHYFKYVASGGESTEPRIEHVRDTGSGDPRLTVSVYAGTGDWFGGWDGDREPEGDRYSNGDATEGRLVELIKQGEPATMLCHWPGMFTQGTKRGFAALKKVILAINGRYSDQTVWMKSSELARYWAARKLTRIEQAGNQVQLHAPIACPDWTIRVARTGAAPPGVTVDGAAVPLQRVNQARDLRSGTWLQEPHSSVVCFDLPTGDSTVRA